MFKPEHGLEFKSYDLDTSEHHQVMIPMEKIKTLVDESLLKKENREELSNTLMGRLKFEGSNLKFDDTPPQGAAAPSAPTPAATSDPPAATPAPASESAPAPATDADKGEESDDYGEASFDGDEKA